MDQNGERKVASKTSNGCITKEWLEPKQERGIHLLLSNDDPNSLPMEDTFLYLVLASGSTDLCKKIFKERYYHMKYSTCIMMGLSVDEMGDLVRKNTSPKQYFSDKFVTSHKGDVNFPSVADNLKICHETNCTVCSPPDKGNFTQFMYNHFFNQNKN